MACVCCVEMWNQHVPGVFYNMWARPLSRNVWLIRSSRVLSISLNSLLAAAPHPSWWWPGIISGSVPVLYSRVIGFVIGWAVLCHHNVITIDVTSHSSNPCPSNQFLAMPNGESSMKIYSVICPVFCARSTNIAAWFYEYTNKCSASYTQVYDNK